MEGKDILKMWKKLGERMLDYFLINFDIFGWGKMEYSKLVYFLVGKEEEDEM